MHANPDLRHLLHTPTGAAYVSQITAQESDRRARAAFRELVMRIAPPDAHLFDFGAGPGLDARFFAERGFTIDAYDVDPRMAEFFTSHCRQLIQDGRVNLTGGSYRQFLARDAPFTADCAHLVVSNFAPLNLVDDLSELFVKFNILTTPRGQVLASVLNPCYLPEVRSRWWWRGAARLWRNGELFLPGPQAPHYRRLLRHFRVASAPHFRLARVFPGLPSLEGRSAWLQLAMSRYMFLLFDKNPGS